MYSSVLALLNISSSPGYGYNGEDDDDSGKSDVSAETLIEPQNTHSFAKRVITKAREKPDMKSPSHCFWELETK